MTSQLAGFRHFLERVDGLELRERALMFTAVLGVLFVLAANALFPGLQKEQKRLEGELQAKREQTRVLNAEVEKAAAAYAEDADARNRARIAELQARLRALDTTAAQQARSLVSPREMPRLVRQVLTRNRALQLVELVNLPPEPLLEPSKTAVVAPAGADARPTPVARTAAPVLYRHGMRVRVKGRYPELASYLHALESLPWKVFWGEVGLRAENYPLSELTLVIYTLGPEEAWIGV
ncbi:MSHA biogenesis protein MshJ [Sulfurifustis variabilis]|uniref:MSHA biogenesis protein MshJ n=1 Tax=Sulfurifustis variabilis TaxID=1675686 RepID=A0A1B4V0M9_9GAMM|nr:hypothetical protein [Sulfurifustis variabilis]BAU47018.1 MSHA biogenesis protein MshJ [Sulfurifustis variabilis]